MLLPALFLFAAPPSTEDLDSALKRFTELISIVETQAADPVNTQQAIYQGAIPGMLRTLDPHSIFFDPDQNEQLKQMENSERKGFGTIVSILPGRVIVLQAMAGTPSAKAGLQPGDEIVAVNGVELARLQFDQVVGYLGESHQHRAQLIVRRPGNVRPLDVRAGSGAAGFAQRGSRVSAATGHRIYPRQWIRSADRASIEGRHREAGRREVEGAGAGFARQSRRRGASRAGSGFLFPEARAKDPQRERPKHRGSDGGSSEDRHSL